MDKFKKALILSTAIFCLLNQAWGMDDENVQESHSIQPQSQKPPAPLKTEPSTHFSSISQASDLYYGDDDISEYIENFLKQRGQFTYFSDFKYLLSGSKDKLTPIKDEGDYNYYIVAVTPAIDTIGITHTVTLKTGGSVSSTNLAYFFDKSLHPKDDKEEILERLITFEPTSNNPYGELHQKIEDLKTGGRKLEFIEDLLSGKDENVDSILTAFQEELKKIKHAKRDIFDELMPVLLKGDFPYAKILFPYNISQVHWLTGEIRIHKAGYVYNLEVYAHDPYGEGIMANDNFMTLKDAITKRITKFHPISILLKICGVFMVHDRHKLTTSLVE